MSNQTTADPFWSLYQPGSKMLRRRIALLNPKLATELGGVWLAAYNKILSFERGKRDQGISHALRVDNNIGLILRSHNLIEKMKAIDLFILSATAVLHDLDKAMKESAEYRHGKSGGEQLQRDSVRLELYLDKRKAEAISYLIAAHHDGNLDVIPKEHFSIGPPPEMLLRGLAAIFRLADMLDFTYERCPKVVAEIPNSVYKEAETLWRATGIIGGWKFVGDKVVLQVIRRHSEKDELALLTILDSLNKDITPSHRKYLENCVIISTEGERISRSLPTGFELDKRGLIFEMSTGLIKLYDRILEKYLEKFHENAEYVNLNGLGVPLEAKKRTPLSDIFIKLSCQRSRMYTSLPRKLRFRKSALTPSSRTESTEMIARLVNYEKLKVHEVVRNDEVGHLVILGHAGSGKSTVVQYLCLLLSDEKQKVSGPIPFNIPVRTFVSEKTKRNDNYSLLDYIVDEVNLLVAPLKCPREFVEYCLKEKGSLVILDGIDEVPAPTQRKDVCCRILEFMKNFENVHIVVTSRIHGYTEAPLSWAGFIHVELDSVEPDDANVFIEKWYSHREPNPRKHEERLTSFRLAMKDESVQQLASNPLLLTIMALVNETGNLPRLRTKLYKTCIDAYLIHREDTKRLLWYNIPEVRSTHEYLAYWIHSELEAAERKEVDAETLEQVLLDFLLSQSPRPQEVQEKKVTNLVKHARNRIGLITENRRGFFSFGLRPIQEYLAACHINEAKAYGIDELWSFLKDKVFNSYWYEVIRFLAGILNQKGREQFLVKAIKEDFFRGTQLAGCVILENNPLPDNLRFEICRKLVQAIIEASDIKPSMDILLQLLRTDAKEVILDQLERESRDGPEKGFWLLFYLKQMCSKNYWVSEIEQIDLISAALVKGWGKKELKSICAIALRETAAELDSAREGIFIDLVDVLCRRDEAIVLEEAKKLSEEQRLNLMRPLPSRPSLRNLINLLRKSLGFPQLD